MLNMNETIRSRRRALGLTQEQAAECLGVSAAAVSKWELGASYPDVALLPALARLLGIDLNTLMGFEREPDRKEISAMLMGILDCARSQGIDAAIERAQALLREYPACGALLFGLAATLEGRLITSGASHEEREKHEALLMGWYLRAADCADPEAREAAAHLLAGKYLARGELEQAQAMMKRLPKEPDAARWPLEVSLLLARGEKQQARKQLENALLRRAGDMQQLLLRLVQAELDEGNADQAQKLADVTRDFVGLLHMHPYTGHLAQLLPALKRQDEEESVKHIRAMLAALKTPWSPGEGLLYEHSGVKKGGHADMLAGIIRELRESEEYAFLRENAAFIALLADHTPA
ncbi:MAG: helix-turn-helix domain-containing protein [Clostridia bacterium]|nr:helix-turn-helix domain-containing protein [Clostridia bacterium]